MADSNLGPQGLAAAPPVLGTWEIHPARPPRGVCSFGAPRGVAALQTAVWWCSTGP